MSFSSPNLQTLHCIDIGTEAEQHTLAVQCFREYASLKCLSLDGVEGNPEGSNGRVEAPGELEQTGHSILKYLGRMSQFISLSH
jgi:hypothetical protein